MEEQEMLDLSRYSRHNSIHLESGECGCYFCLRTFAVDEIEDWKDEGLTALCPHCDMDTILPGVIDEDTLIEMCKRWFGMKGEE